MTDEQPIDLIRRMPNLYYAAELAARAPDEQMPTGYAEAVLARANELYEAIAQCIIDSELTAGQRARAADALNMIRYGPRDRARLDLTAKVFNSVPIEKDGIGRQAHESLLANFAEARKHINAEAIATRDLVHLLHTKAA